MTGIAIAPVLLTVYLIIGARIARRRLPRAWEKARAAWHSTENIRASVQCRTIGAFLFWPVIPVILACCAVMGRLDHLIDSGDPVMLARKIDERDRRIAQLEDEAGLR